MRLLDFPPTTSHDELASRVQLHLTPTERARHLRYMLAQRQQLMRSLRFRMRALRSELALLCREVSLKHKPR